MKILQKLKMIKQFYLTAIEENSRIVTEILAYLEVTSVLIWSSKEYYQNRIMNIDFGKYVKG